MDKPTPPYAIRQRIQVSARTRAAKAVQRSNYESVAGALGLSVQTLKNWAGGSLPLYIVAERVMERIREDGTVVSAEPRP